jgi:hypothetical protein
MPGTVDRKVPRVLIDRIGTGTLTAIAFVLLVAALAKRGRPALAGVELAVAALALLAPVRIGAAASGGLFAAFAAVHARRWRAGAGEECGCLGESTGAEGPRALALTAVPAAAMLAFAVSGIGASRSLGATIVALPVAVAWLAAFRGRPLALGRASERLVDGTARLLERRVSRRGALARVAVGGSALAVAPLRYLLYPGTAMAAIVPGDCGGGLCTDGYTAFCCEINHGLNTCPAGTYSAGWWMCTDYAGRLLCSEQGVRYYVDCNRIPGTHFPGGCKCANDNCNERRVACNVFRYGQCNVQVPGITEVVCRMVVCENPSRIPELHCNASLAVDDAVCGHDHPCLVPEAVELGAAGGV